MLGLEEVIADNLKAVCSWIFHLTTEGLGELTGLEASCTKYLLCLIVFQMRGTHLMLCNEEGEERSVVCLSPHSQQLVLDGTWCCVGGSSSCSSPQQLIFPHPCRELGRQRSVIELDTPCVTAEQIEALERSVNEKIRERVPVTVRELAADDPEVETVSDGVELTLAVGPKRLWHVCRLLGCSLPLLGEKPWLTG